MSKIPLGRPRGQMSESMLTAAFIILSGGLQDAYTYLCRGKVFANAQTGNIVLFSAYLFDGDWAHSRRVRRCLPRVLLPVRSLLRHQDRRHRVAQLRVLRYPLHQRKPPAGGFLFSLFAENFLGNQTFCGLFRFFLPIFDGFDDSFSIYIMLELC